jgi:hypothetical protein
MRRKYMPVFVDCNCEGLWKRAYFFAGLRAIRRDRRGRTATQLSQAESGLDCVIKLRSWAGVRLTTKNGSRLRKLIQNWLNCSLGRKRSRAGRNF